mmetsp:Transcript_83094/g.185624  ORF Transcript_83094/g.185624 Transcript_83094/m.185624 type:complete len:533 (+) Transcript_83094:79-1677(+)
MENGQTWEVVGGGDKGGILVREGQDMKSPQEQERLSTGALVCEVELVGERLCFERLSGSGPERGWVSINLKEKTLLAKTDRRPTEAEVKAREAEKVVPPEAVAALAEASAALKADANFEAANDAFTAMAGVWSCKAARPQLLMARGLLLWRWSLLGKALSHLKEAEKQHAKGAPLALLALRLCLSQWPEARDVAERLGRKDALEVIDRWEAASFKMHVFHPEETQTERAKFVPQDVEVMPGVRQTDVKIRTSDDEELGARLLLQVDKAGQPVTQQPLFLCFHREDEDVDTYVKKANSAFEPLQAASASAIVIDYRGHGFSTGEPAQKLLNADAEFVCDALPGIFKERNFPWPWPGGFALFGSQLGSRVACHLAGVRGQLFDKGVVIETAWCGSHAPGAKPPQAPREGDQERFEKIVWGPAVVAATVDVGAFCRTLVTEAGSDHAEAFCYVRGNEDLIRGFDGRLLVIHGEQDVQTEYSHAQRLHDAAESARRTIRIIKGKGPDILRADEKYKSVLKWFLGQMTDDEFRKRGL